MQEKMETPDARCEQPTLVGAKKKGKMTPTSLVNKFASEVQRQYQLLDESRPPHKRPFTVVLKMDSEEYTSSERSFMTTEHATAKNTPLGRSHLKAPKAARNTKLEPPQLKAPKATRNTPLEPPHLKASQTGRNTPPDPPQIKASQAARNTPPDPPQLKASQTARNTPSKPPQTKAPKAARNTSSEPPHLKATKSAKTTPLEHPQHENHELNAMRPLSPIAELNDLACQRLARPLYMLIPVNSVSRKPKGNTRTYQFFLTVFKKQFHGEGGTEMEAKTAAAVKALNLFSTLPYPEYVERQKEQSVPEIKAGPVEEIKEVAIEGDIVKNPVTLEHQTARKRDLRDNSVATQETPSNRIVGKVTAKKEGTTEKGSKKKAARKILEEKKKLHDLPPPDNKKKKKNTKTDRNLIKMGDTPTDGPDPDKITSTNNASVAMSQRVDSSRTIASHAQSPETSERIVARPQSSENVYPVGRLNKIQRSKKERGPRFTVIDERGEPPHVEVIVQCVVGGNSTEGSGSNKTAAIRSAAEAMLQRMDYYRKTKTGAGTHGQLIGFEDAHDKMSTDISDPDKGASTSNAAETLFQGIDSSIAPAVDALSPGTFGRIVEPKAHPQSWKDIHPIGRLNQIQRAKKESGPKFTVVDERGEPPHVEVIVQCTLGDISTDGTGPNKMDAMCNAAEAMLRRLDYSEPTTISKKTHEQPKGFEGLDVYRNQGSEMKELKSDDNVSGAQVDVVDFVSRFLQAVQKTVDSKGQDFLKESKDTKRGIKRQRQTEQQSSGHSDAMEYSLHAAGGIQPGSDDASTGNRKDAVGLDSQDQKSDVTASGTQIGAADFVSRFAQVVQMAADLKGPNGVLKALKDAKSASRTQRQTEQQSSGHSAAMEYSLQPAGGVQPGGDDASIGNRKDVVGLDSQDDKSWVKVSGTQMDAVDFVSQFVQVVQLAADLKGPNGVSKALKDAKSGSKTQRQTEQRSFRRSDARDYRVAAGGNGSIGNRMDAVKLNSQDEKNDQRVSALPAKITKKVRVENVCKGTDEDGVSGAENVGELQTARTEENSAESRVVSEKPSIDRKGEKPSSKLLRTAVDNKMKETNFKELEAEAIGGLKLKRKAYESVEIFFSEVGERLPKISKEDSNDTDDEAINGNSAKSRSVSENQSMANQGDKPSSELVEKASDNEMKRMSLVELNAETIDERKLKRKADDGLLGRIFFPKFGESPAKQRKEDSKGHDESVTNEDVKVGKKQDGRMGEELDAPNEDTIDRGENVRVRLAAQMVDDGKNKDSENFEEHLEEPLENDSAESRSFRGKPTIYESSSEFDVPEKGVEIEMKKTNSEELCAETIEDMKLKRKANGYGSSPDSV